MKASGIALFVAGVFVGAWAVGCVAGPSGAPAKERMFELRTYTTHPGKLDDLHKRFRDHTNALFEKHGIDLIGFWTPAEGPEAANTLTYLIAFPDRASREKSFKDFLADPDWQKAYKASRENGPIVQNIKNTFLKPTDYSYIK